MNYRIMNLKETILGVLNPKEKRDQMAKSIEEAVRRLRAINKNETEFVFIAIGIREGEVDEGKRAIAMDTLVFGEMSKPDIAKCLEAQVDLLSGNAIKMTKYWDGKPKREG